MMNGRVSSFEQCYRCYRVSFFEKEHLENGDKIIMPPSALDRLASLHIEFPMLFELMNVSAETITHCGVLEFIADEGLVYLPYWMMQNMLLQEGDLVRVKNASLVKGTYIKLQPHTQDFLDITNPKAILETALRSYSCLTTGDTIMVPYNNKKYFINVVETKPSSAVSIIETDCEADFAPPLDYKEPEKPQKSVSSSQRPPEAEEEPQSEVPRFTPFTGLGRRLDGTATRQQEQPSEKGREDSKPSRPAPRQHSGKLVFGPSSSPSVKEAAKVDDKRSGQETATKSEEPKLQVFTGKKYTLKG